MLCNRIGPDGFSSWRLWSLWAAVFPTPAVFVQAFLEFVRLAERFSQKSTRTCRPDLLVHSTGIRVRPCLLCVPQLLLLVILLQRSTNVRHFGPGTLRSLSTSQRPVATTFSSSSASWSSCVLFASGVRFLQSQRSRLCSSANGGNGGSMVR